MMGRGCGRGADGLALGAALEVECIAHAPGNK